MSTPIIASWALLFVGVLIGSLPLLGGFRRLPRWIRIAQFLIGFMFIIGALIAFALYSAGDRLSYRLHHFIFVHVVLIVGMGLGVILLLLVSGEYFRALRELDAARRSRLAAQRDEQCPQNEPSLI